MFCPPVKAWSVSICFNIWSRQIWSVEAPATLWMLMLMAHNFADLSCGIHKKHHVTTKKTVVIEISYPINWLYPNSFIRNIINISKSPTNNLVPSSIAKALPIFGKLICEEKRLMFFCPNKGGRKTKVCLSTTKSYHRSWFRWCCTIN